MSDMKAAKDEIIRDLDRAILNMEAVEQKRLPTGKRDEILWSMKLLRVARKSIIETLHEF